MKRMLLWMEGFTSFLLLTGKLVIETAFQKLPHQVGFDIAFASCSCLPTSLYWLLLYQKAYVFKTTSVIPTILVNNIILLEDTFQPLFFNSQDSITRQIVSQIHIHTFPSHDGSSKVIIVMKLQCICSCAELCTQICLSFPSVSQ